MILEESKQALKTAEYILDDSSVDPDEAIAILARQLLRTREKLEAVWHFALCPYDHCEECIADAALIKSLHRFVGNPTSYKSPKHSTSPMKNKEV